MYRVGCSHPTKGSDCDVAELQGHNTTICVLLLFRLCRLATMDRWLWHTLITTHAHVFSNTCRCRDAVASDTGWSATYVYWWPQSACAFHKFLCILPTSCVTPMNHTIDNLVHRLHHFSQACIVITQPTQFDPPYGNHIWMLWRHKAQHSPCHEQWDPSCTHQ